MTRFRRPRPGSAPCLAALVLLLAACGSGPAPVDSGTALSMGGHLDRAASSKAQIETELARGTPASLAKARDRIEAEKALAPSDVILYRWYAVELGRIAYPETLGKAPVVPEPPTGHPWARAVAAARTGRLGTPRDGAEPLELLALASSVFRGESLETSRTAAQALGLFEQAGYASPLADCIRGLLAERSGNAAEAHERYIRAFSDAQDCYPAFFGSVRALLALGRPDKAAGLLDAYKAGYESNLSWIRLMALALYDSGRYEEANPFVTQVLRQDPLDSLVLLLRADMLVRAGDYLQAIPLLDAYGAVDSSNRRYLLLRGRTAWEGSRNREEALRYLRKLLSMYPDDVEASLAAARILAGGTPAERGEAYTLAGRVLALNPRDAGALRILLAEDVKRRNWASAAVFLDRLRAADPGYADRGTMHLVYRSSGRLDDAFRVAVEWMSVSPDSEDARIAHIRSLIDRRDAAAARDLVARALTGKGSSKFRSGLYYLQSLLQPNDEAALNALRSSLVENVQNLEALTAMYDIYMRQKDAQKARFYLRQALAVAPEEPGLARRREELIRLGLAP